MCKDIIMYKCSILLLYSTTINIALAFNVSEYLFRYGYLDKPNESAITDLEHGIAHFQDFYGLEVDGTLNNETLDLMQRPRCGMADPSSYEVTRHKWNKTDITWYFSLGNKTHTEIAAKAFDLWQNYTNLNITQSIKNPDIVISFADKPAFHKQNSRCMGGGDGGRECLWPFDGKGYSLAHAFYPLQNNSCIEIHLDSSEIWYLGYGDNKTSLYGFDS